MSQNLSVERVNIGNLNEVWAICTEIARNMVYPSFFCSGQWLKASAENLCSNDELIILMVSCDGCVKAVLPLVKRRNALGGSDLLFLGTDFYPDPVGLISAPSDRTVCSKVLLDYLFNISGWDRFIFDCILEDELADWDITGKPISMAPFKVLPPNFTDLLGEFKQKKRYNLRAMVKKFMEAGGELLISQDMSTHNVYLDELYSLHGKRASERSLNSSIKSPRVKALHKNLASSSNDVRFYALRLNNQFVAVIYGFEFCNRFFYYQVAHDPAYGYLSPGSVLLFLVIEYCCKRGVSEFNFLQGDETYKSIWTNDYRVLYRCVLKSNTWRSRLFDAFEESTAYYKRVMGLITSGN